MHCAAPRTARVLPAPLDVLRAAQALAESGELLKHVQVSAGRALGGLAIGGGLGLALGLLTGSLRWAETLLDSTIQMVRNIPALALIPLVILWFGIDETAKLFLVALGVFFPVYLNTFHGIRAVDSALVEMARSYGLSGWRLYREVILPGATLGVLGGGQLGRMMAQAAYQHHVEPARSCEITCSCHLTSSARPPTVSQMVGM